MKINPLIAFYNDSQIKKKYLTRMRDHRLADNLLQSYRYWEDGKGCAVGCLMEVDKNPHKLYPKKLGLPVWLAYLEDHIFEALPNKEAILWPEQFLEAIKVGAKITDRVRDEFQVFWLEHNLEAVDRELFPVVTKAVASVINLLKDSLHGNEAKSAAWSTAKLVAESAAESATEAAAWSTALSAAWSATRSSARSIARSATESAAQSVARSVDRSSARSVAELEAIIKRDFLLQKLAAL